MKNLLFGIFTVIASAILMLFMGNVIFAQGNGNPNPAPAPETEEVNDIGIHLKGDCLNGMGKGCFDYEKMIGIDKEQDENITAMSIVQDVIQAASYMVGTVLTIVIIYCGFMYILASADGKDVNSYKKGLISAAIGALLVWGAYAIVRLIQYIAKG